MSPGPRALGTWVLAGIPLAFLGVFFFLPLYEIFSLSLAPEGVLKLGVIGKFFSTTYYARILWFTTWQAALSTVLTLALALPGAYVFARFTFPGKDLLRALVTVPFVLPTVVVASAFDALLGRSGVLNTTLAGLLTLETGPIHLEHTIAMILLAHVFYNMAVVIRLVGGFWSQIDPALAEAARLLGASSWQTFCRITLPLIRPAILAAALLIFMFCFSSFGVILILGGPRFSTVEVEIYRQAVHLFNLPMASLLSLIQIVFTFVLMWFYTTLQRRSTTELTPESVRITQRPVAGWRERLVVGGHVLLTVLLMGGPLMALVLRSLMTEQGPSLVYYRALFANPAGSVFYVPPIQAIGYSLGFAALTLLLSLVLGLSASALLARPRGALVALLDPLFMLPLSTSAVTLGFGFILAFDEPPLNLRASLILVPLAHALVAFPFVVRALLPALKSIPASMREAASVLGASPAQVWRRVDLPIVTRALVAGALFAFTVSMGEFGATVFVARPQSPTIPLAIYRFLSQPGALNYGQAMAMSSILMLTTCACFLILDRGTLKGGL